MNAASKALVILAFESLHLNAQMNQGVIAKVPFDFVAGQKIYTAGEYHVSLTSPNGVVSIRSLDGKGSGLTLCGRSESTRARRESKLVFNRYGGEYFLKSVFREGETTGLEFRKTDRELQVEAKIKRAPQTILASARK